MEYNNEGYEVIGKTLSKEDQGRGILVYVKKDVPYNNVCLKEE